jgi:hypothetical protein
MLTTVVIPPPPIPIQNQSTALTEEKLKQLTGECSCSDKFPYIPRKSTEKTPNAKDGIGEEKRSLATEYVADFAI